MESEIKSRVKARAAISPILSTVENLGALRTIVYNYAIAKSQDGEFVYRCDDTDPTKHTKSNTLSWKNA